MTEMALPTAAETVGAPGRVEMTVDAIDTYYYAASHHAVVRRIVVRNIDVPETADDIVVTVKVESPLGTPPLHDFTIAIPAFAPRDEKAISSIRMTPDHRALALLDEQVPGHLVVTATVSGEVVGTVRRPITFLAFNQWMFRPEYFDSLAAFVQPNSSAVRPVLSRAGDLLAERTGSDSTEGYQSGPGRAVEIARAVYDALREQNLRYTNPPASFEGYGQKVRTPEVVMGEGAATCLDSTVLFASCLLAVGLDAYLVVVSGHAFIGFWDGERGSELEPLLRASVVDNPNEIALLQRAGRITPVETTTFTAERDEVSFDQAVSRNLGYFTTRTDELLAIVNIEYARSHGVPPIPSQQILGAVVAAEATLESTAVEWEPEPTMGGLRPVAAVTQELDSVAQDRTADGVADAPPRVRSWLRSLLDLSFANPLLRLGGKSGKRGVFHVELPPGLLAALEDRLMEHGFLEIRPVTDAPVGILRDPDDVSVVGSVLTDSGRLFWPDVATYERELGGLKAQVQEESPEAAPAEVDKWVVAALRSAFGKHLEKELGALRRKAREIEAQTGVNTLFLAIGTLSWSEVGGRRGAGAETGRAPLFLIPVRISGKASTGFRISADDAADVIPNYCLLEKLRQTYNITIEDLERPVTDGSGIDVDRMIAKVRESLGNANVRDAVVVEDASLAILNFSTFRLWKDLRDHWQTFLGSPVVKHLVETPNETFDNPADDIPAVPDQVADDIPCPIDCDQSQLEAVRWSTEGRSFVLEGPPGTGKSQTIANLLAANIAAGKKVLFVAEKQAALEVVKKRLDRVGLGPFCLDLHDKGSKPDQIRDQIRMSLDFQPNDREAEWQEINARWTADRTVLDSYRAALHTPGPAGMTAWEGHQERLRESDADLAPFDIPPAFLAQSTDLLARVRQALLDLPRVTGPTALEPAFPWGLCAVEDFNAIDTAALGNALSTLVRIRAALTQASTAQPLLAGIVTPHDLVRTVEVLDLWLVGRLLTQEDAAQIGSPAWLSKRDNALSHLDRALAAQQPILDVFVPGVFAADLSSQIAAGLDASTAGMFSKGKKTKIFYAAVAPLLRTSTEHDIDDLLRLLQQVEPAMSEVSATTAAIAAVPGISLRPGWSTLDPSDVAWLRERLTQMSSEAALQLSDQASRVRSALSVGGPVGTEVVELLRSANSWWSHFCGLLGTTPPSEARWRGDRSFLDAWAESEAHWLGAQPRFLSLQRWCQVLAAVRPLQEAGLGHIADAVLQGEVAGPDAYERFHVGFIASAIKERLEAGRIDLFDGRAHDRTIEDFIVRDRKRRELLQDRIPASLVEGRPVRGGRRIGKWGALEQELQRRSRKLSIRRLIDEYGEILPDLTPCFLMSPDSVARFIPPGSITFDLVVFDEASQIEVPEAIGAMGRARAVVVVGDTRQMPPSRFGGGSPAGDEDVDTEDESLYVDLESILSECVESNLPRLYLQCHYRSRHEGLIAFSNRNFYEGRLTTFPSPAGPHVNPIGWRRINGDFDRSPGEFNRTNRAEAEAIVQEVLTRLSDPETQDQSIGVVTLNATQQALVTKLLEDSGDERVRSLLEDDGEDGLIVRNLESVQGDERDVIMLSIAFAPSQSVNAADETVRGRLGLNFGPLNKKGGERRLNVAVTRARAEVVVFCSFEPEEMNLTENSSVGLQLLKSYLHAARDGIERSADLIGRAPTPPDLHRSEIAEALRARGLRVRENVGLSTFRVDLAVGNEEDEDWSVAVLLDGPGWAKRSTVYDRDALPASVLHGAMGWKKVHRLWFPMWLHARDEVLDDIVALVERAHEPSTAMVEAERRVEQAADSTRAELNGDDGGALESTPRSDPMTSVPDATESAVLTSVTQVSPDPESTNAKPEPVDSKTPAELLAALPIVGEKWVLDDLEARGNRVTVQRTLEEILQIAAPISAQALGKAVATRFGYAQVRQNRIDSILSCLPRGQMKRTKFGDFVWLADQDPESWNVHRSEAQYGAARPVEQIAPEEIRNAMVDITRGGLEVSGQELIRHTAETFGTRRISAGIRDHLTAVLAWTVKTGYLVSHAERSDMYRLPHE